METLRIGHQPRLSAQDWLGWATRVARSMLAVCGVGVASLVVALTVVDMLTQ